jgi:hypothetical protein
LDFCGGVLNIQKRRAWWMKLQREPTNLKIFICSRNIGSSTSYLYLKYFIGIFFVFSLCSISKMHTWHFLLPLTLLLQVQGSPVEKITIVSSSRHAQPTKSPVHYESEPQIPAAPYPPKLVTSPDTLAMPPPSSVKCQLQGNPNAGRTQQNPDGFGQIEFTITGGYWPGDRDQMSTNLEKKFLPPNSDYHCQLITTPNSWTFAWDPVRTQLFIAKGAFPLDEKPNEEPADIRLSAVCLQAALQEMVGRSLKKSEQCAIVQTEV